MEYFDFTKYQEQANHFFQDPDIYKVVGTSSIFRDSTKRILFGLENVYYLSDGLAECKKYSMTISNDWNEYDENLIPPYGNGLVIKFTDNNPYNLRWLLRTDGNYFISHGQITNPSFSGKYQNSPWTKQEIFNNIYVVDCVDFNASTFKDEILYASWWTMADIGALACTTTGEYKICLKGPSEKNADFKKWLVSITNPRSLILTEDTSLIISIAISNGMVKALHNNNWIKKVQNIFKIKIDST